MVLTDYLSPAVLTLTQLFIVSLMIEALAENVIWVIEGKWSKERLIPFIGAIVVSLLVKLDLFKFAGMDLAVPVVGYALSGVVLARGANILHDIAARLGLTPPPGEDRIK